MNNVDIVQSIKNRRSQRGYTSQTIETHKLEGLRNCLNNTSSPFKGQVRYEIVSLETPGDTPLKLGTYGTIKGANQYMISAIKNDSIALETLGYQMEMAVLEASSLGLGTCWLGGTFNRGQFAQVLNLKADEILPIVIPFGYPASKDGFIGGMIRNIAGSNQRKDWDELFFKGQLNLGDNLGEALSKEEAGPYAEVLEMVRIGPSASNKQPWRIIKEGKAWHFVLSQTKGYGAALGYDIQRVDMGIAVCHFEMGARAMALEGSWQFVDISNHKKRDDMRYIISWIEN